MGIAFQKILSQLLFWIYDFIDTVGALFNIFTGTQKVSENGKTLLEVFVDSAISTKVLLGLIVITIIIAGACVGVKTVKNVFKLKAGGEAVSHSATVGQGFIAVLSSVFSLSVEQSYVLDESELVPRYSDYYNEYGEREQDVDENGNLKFDEDDQPVYKQVVEYVYEYKKDSNGDYVVYETRRGIRSAQKKLAWVRAGRQGLYC